MYDTLIQGLLFVGGIHVLAAATPGPDMFMVTQQSLTRGRGSGLYCSLGITLGLSVHLAYTCLGVAALIAASPSALTAIRIIGGCFLTYIGIRSILAKGSGEVQDGVESTPVSAWKSFVMGLLCNIFNPKAPIYFMSLFSLVLSPSMPAKVLLIYALWIMLIQFLWFAFVALVFSSKLVHDRFLKAEKLINRVYGSAMIILGFKLMVWEYMP